MSVSPPPPPIVILDMESMYAPGTGSTQIDPAARAAYADKLRPIQSYTRTLALLADNCAKSRAPALEVRCALIDWLKSWADAQALTQGVTEQGRAVMAWELGSIASAWLKLKDDDAATPVEKAAINTWIGTLRELVVANYSADGDRNSRNNNHIYWAAWSTMCASIALGDVGGFAWSESVFDRAMAQIGIDGALPLEMARRQRALHYHSFALAPLTLIAECLILNGRASPYAAADAPLRRLADLTLRGVAAPDHFEARAGAPQDVSDLMTASQLAWLEPYYARTGDDRAVPLFTQFRPMFAPRLGGDLSYYFAGVTA